MIKAFIIFLGLFVTQWTFSAPRGQRVKDLVDIKGVRENPLIGYGLVVGLNGTGDGGGEITNTSLKKMFQTLGLNPQNEISSKNVAAVIVTSKFSTFSRTGQKIDVKVSSIGDASSLSGGTLLVTPLKGGDGKIYAVAHGQVSTGGLTQGKGPGTIGNVTNGATIERELKLNFDKKKSLQLGLKNPDFTTAARLEKRVNEELGGKFAMARDSTTIDLIIPVSYQRKVVQLMAILENIRLVADQRSKIIINERTGTVVAGGEVSLRPVALSHGDLTIQVAAAEGDEEAPKGPPGRVFSIPRKSTLNDLVKALNTLGVGPHDLIAIFQALKSNGALVGDIEFI